MATSAKKLDDRALLYGMSMLCGVGFTMSLFIGSPAFEHSSFDAPIRLGILTGSVASTVVVYLLLRFGIAPTQDVAKNA